MHVVHLIIISLSMFGFLFTDYLSLYLTLQFLVLCSWLGYGFYDNRWGCCIVTEVQWAIKEKKGLRPDTDSYIQYWIKNKLGINANESRVGLMTILVYGLTTLIGSLRYFDIII